MKISKIAEDYIVNGTAETPLIIEPNIRIKIRSILTYIKKETGFGRDRLANEILGIRTRRDIPQKIQYALENRLKTYACARGKEEEFENITSFNIATPRTIDRFLKNPLNTSDAIVAVILDYLIIIGRFDPRDLDICRSLISPAITLRDSIPASMVDDDFLSGMVGKTFATHERRSDGGRYIEVTFTKKDFGVYFITEKIFRVANDDSFSSVPPARNMLVSPQVTRFWMISIRGILIGYPFNSDESPTDYNSPVGQILHIFQNTGRFTAPPLEECFCAITEHLSDSSSPPHISDVNTKNDQCFIELIHDSESIFARLYNDISVKFAENPFFIYSDDSGKGDLRFFDTELVNILDEKIKMSNKFIDLFEEWLKTRSDTAKEKIIQAIDGGTNVNAVVNSMGDRLLHVASVLAANPGAQDARDIVQACMARKDVDLLARNKKGWIPLDSVMESVVIKIIFGEKEPFESKVIFEYLRKYSTRQAREKGIFEEYCRRSQGELDSKIPPWKPPSGNDFQEPSI